jgi:hypothetical protein
MQQLCVTGHSELHDICKCARCSRETSDVCSGGLKCCSCVQNVSDAVVGAIDTRIYTGAVTEISCQSGPVIIAQ